MALVPRAALSRRSSAMERDTAMARLTDSNGALLGGLDTLSSELLTPPSETKTAAILAPPAVPPTPEYGPEEIIFALECSYGSLAYLTYASAITRQASNYVAPQTRHRDCQRLIEEPHERHYCPECGGYYCARHASPDSHDCRSVMQMKPSR